MKAPLRRMAAALFTAAIFLAAAVFGARAEGPPSLQRTLSDRYGVMRLAMAEGDAAKVGAMLAPGFHSVSLSGRSEDAAEMLKFMTARPEQERPKVFTTGVEVVKQDDARAVVTQTYEMKAVKPRVGGEADMIRIVALSTDAWVKKGSEWLLESSETQSADLYINEKLEKHVVREAQAPASSPAPPQ